MLVARTDPKSPSGDYALTQAELYGPSRVIARVIPAAAAAAQAGHPSGASLAVALGLDLVRQPMIDPLQNGHGAKQSHTCCCCESSGGASFCREPSSWSWSSILSEISLASVVSASPIPVPPASWNLPSPSVPSPADRFVLLAQPGSGSAKSASPIPGRLLEPALALSAPSPMQDAHSCCTIQVLLRHAAPINECQQINCTSSNSNSNSPLPKRSQHVQSSTFASGVGQAEALLDQAGKQRGGHVAQLGGSAVQLQGLWYGKQHHSDKGSHPTCTDRGSTSARWTRGQTWRLHGAAAAPAVHWTDRISSRHCCGHGAGDDSQLPGPESLQSHSHRRHGIRTVCGRLMATLYDLQMPRRQQSGRLLCTADAELAAVVAWQKQHSDCCSVTLPAAQQAGGSIRIDKAKCTDHDTLIAA